MFSAATIAAWLEEFVMRLAHRFLVHCADNELEVVPAAVALENYVEADLQLQAIHLGYRRVVVLCSFADFQSLHANVLPVCLSRRMCGCYNFVTPWQSV